MPRNQNILFVFLSHVIICKKAKRLLSHAQADALGCSWIGRVMRTCRGVSKKVWSVTAKLCSCSQKWQIWESTALSRDSRSGMNVECKIDLTHNDALESENISGIEVNSTNIWNHCVIDGKRYLWNVERIPQIFVSSQGILYLSVAFHSRCKGTS